MMYYINMFFFSFKQIAFFINSNYTLQMSFNNFSLILLELLYFIIFIKIASKPDLKVTVNFHILKYCYYYTLERVYSLIFVTFAFSLYLGLFGYLRFVNFDKTLNLIDIWSKLKDIFLELPLIVFIFNIILFIVFIYLVLLCLKVYKHFVHIEIVKLHFYYLDKEFYSKIHLAILGKYSLDSFVIDKVLSMLSVLNDYMALGYKKNFWLYTKDERIIRDKLFEKISKTFYYIKIFFYNLHYICFFIALFYDIFYNNYTLCYLFKCLPLILLYQMYINISKFVIQKPVIEVCGEVNKYFYHDIIFVDDNAVLIDGELYERSTTFAQDFLYYEASGFTKYWREINQ
jgi:hypothetical protein